jgi:hypothetical protein
MIDTRDEGLRRHEGALDHVLDAEHNERSVAIVSWERDWWNWDACLGGIGRHESTFDHTLEAGYGEGAVAVKS